MIAAMTRLEAAVVILTTSITAIAGIAGAVWVAKLSKQAKPNGGSSFRDTVENMLIELRSVNQLLRSHGDRIDDVADIAAATRRMQEHQAAQHDIALAEVRRELEQLRSHHP